MSTRPVLQQGQDSARRVHRQRHVLVSIDMIGHGPQRRGMPLLAARLLLPAAFNGGFDKLGRRLVVRRRRGRQFFVLLFEAAILRLELFDLLLPCVVTLVVTLVGKVPFLAVMIAIGSEKLGFLNEALRREETGGIFSWTSGCHGIFKPSWGSPLRSSWRSPRNSRSPRFSPPCPPSSCLSRRRPSGKGRPWTWSA